MTMQQAVLTKILNCGSDDLRLLEDIEYDLDDIIQDLMDNGCLNLHGIFKEVFYMGASDLQAVFNETKDEIRDDILQAIEDDKEEWVASGEMTQAELEDCPEYQELLAHLELLDSGKLHPIEDLGFYLNYQDTHVSMKHIDFYRRWMETKVDEIENNMGWSFEEGV